jgi:hypothetical protein
MASTSAHVMFSSTKEAFGSQLNISNKPEYNVTPYFSIEKIRKRNYEFEYVI